MTTITELPTPRLPGWAAAVGVNEPEPGEGFREYWRRIQIPDDVIEAALDVFRPGAIDCANDRLASYLQTMMPAAFAAHVEARAGRWRPDPLTIDQLLRMPPR